LFTGEGIKRYLPGPSDSVVGDVTTPRVRRLAVSSAAYDIDGYLPQIKEGLLNPRPEAFPEIIRESYERVAPKPEQWSTLVAKAGEQAPYVLQPAWMT
jgi:hypothetical protein